MKLKHLSLMAFAATAFLAGCAKEPALLPEQNGELLPLNISGAIVQTHTKATAEGFVNGDAVGLFAVNYTDNNTVPGTLLAEGNQADNVKYVFDEPNQKWAPVKAVYYKDVNTHADIYLYYPYQSSIKDVNEAGFEVKKDQSAAATVSSLSGYEASDFLWGKGENITPSQSAVRIALGHRLSAVEVNLVEGTGFAEDEFAGLEKSVILTSTTRKATINYATGEATPLGGPQLDGIVMCPQEGGSWRAIVIPQTVTAGTQLFAITVNGVPYKFSQAEDVKYLAGKQLVVNITVNKKTPAGDLEFTLAGTQITDWTEDKNTHGGEARQYFVVNVEEPGTLGNTIEAMGKDPNKIKNLKVIGQITTEDFKYMKKKMADLQAIDLNEVKIKNVQMYGDSYYIDGVFVHDPDKHIGDNIIPAFAFSEKKSLYYFVFPQELEYIDYYAFYKTPISGHLIIPDGTKGIAEAAFKECEKITGLSLPPSIERIGYYAFSDCKLMSGQLLLPESLTNIGASAFVGCKELTGHLILPSRLNYLGPNVFGGCSGFTGSLEIPDGVKILYGGVFYNCSGLTGKLVLHDGLRLSGSDEFHICSTRSSTESASPQSAYISGGSQFSRCGFTGELVLPTEISAIPNGCFSYNNFSSISKFPDSLIKIGDEAFFKCMTLSCVLNFPENTIDIGADVFNDCRNLKGAHLGSKILSISDRAFYNCFGISEMSCMSVEPPLIGANAFDGVAKDNFTLEVPAQSVKDYEADTKWSYFKRISAYHDFSISRRKIVALNAETSRHLILRAPSKIKWRVEEVPDWVSVSPNCGIGKIEITITVNAMPYPFGDEFEVNEGDYNHVIPVKYSGRKGSIVFKIDEESIDYTTELEIEQYDSEYCDAQVIEIQKASKGNGIDIIFVGDGYDAKDIAKGTFDGNVQEGITAFFDIEPYKTYKDYFNVYAVVSQSNDSGIGTVNTVVDTKFGTYFTQNRIKVPAPEPLFSWAKKADNGVDFTKALVINLMNTSAYEGICAMYGDGSAIAFCPVSRDAYPYDFRGIIQHEAGGHGFGKLGDEYIYHNAFIQTCGCICCDHGDVFNAMKAKGWYKNLSMNGDMHQVPWAHLIYNPNYSNYVDMYEGGYMHSRGVYRSEATSCMNNNIPYYSAISRQAMVERIMSIAGEEFTLEKFYAKDKDDFGTIPTTKSSATPINRTYGVDPLWNRGSEEGSVIYMGEHPDYSKIK